MNRRVPGHFVHHSQLDKTHTLRMQHDGSEWTEAGGMVLSPEAAQRLSSRYVETFDAVAGDEHLGPAEITRDIPGVGEAELGLVDERGLVRLNSTVEPGSILVAMRAPRPVHQAQAKDTDGAEAAEPREPTRWMDISTRVPPGVHGVVTGLRDSPAIMKMPRRVEVDVTRERPLEVGDGLETPDGKTHKVTHIRALPNGVDALWNGAEGSVEVRKVTNARDCMHARSVGPYALISQQPLGGQRAFGGQRVDRADVWTAWRRGARTVALEWMTVKSDNPSARSEIYQGIVLGKPELKPELPTAVKVLESELFALAIKVDFSQPHLKLTVASAQGIRESSCGLVNKPETFRASNLIPERGGLFCEQVFGSVGSEARRNRFGHVELCVPVLHPWFFEATVDLLRTKRRHLRKVLTNQGVWKEQPDGTLTAEEVEHAALEQTGGLAVRERLQRLLDSPGSTAESAQARALAAAGVNPLDWLLTVLPVLPPDLRPLVPVRGKKFATSDLNDLYRSVIHANNRLVHQREAKVPGGEQRNDARALQQAVDDLMANGLLARARRHQGRNLVSLTDLVGPRLHGNMLKKRVDYSGVAALVPDPQLTDGYCRLPMTLVLELYRPFLYARLERDGMVHNVKEAKRLVDAGGAVVMEAAHHVTRVHPVVLLPAREHEEGRGGRSDIVACDVLTWDQPAIAVSPAIFRRLGTRDVAIHLPLTPEAIEEASTLLNPDAPVPPAQRPASPGWFARAIFAKEPEQVLIKAIIHGETDPVVDPWARLALGRKGG